MKCRCCNMVRAHMYFFEKQCMDSDWSEIGNYVFLNNSNISKNRDFVIQGLLKKRQGKKR